MKQSVALGHATPETVACATGVRFGLGTMFHDVAAGAGNGVATTSPAATSIDATMIRDAAPRIDPRPRAHRLNVPRLSPTGDPDASVSLVGLPERSQRDTRR